MEATVEKADLVERPDGYWLQMGTRATEALKDVLRDDLTPRRREVVAEYLGGLMDMAYNSGLGLGRMAERLRRNQQ